MKAIVHHFPSVLFIMLYMVFLTFQSVDEILECDHLDESYRAVLSRGTGSNQLLCGWNSKVWSLK